MDDEAATKIRDNEVIRYVAAALDRLSTGTLIVGFVGPITILMSDPSKTLELDYKRWVASGLASACWIGVSYSLHRSGKRALLRGFK